MRNVHERRIAAAPAEVGALLALLGGPHDRLWPADDWMPMTLDRPLGVGARGGHSDIRYAVTAYEPGRRVEFTVVPPTSLVGWHAFEVDATPDGTTLLRHVLAAEPRGERLDRHSCQATVGQSGERRLRPVLRRQAALPFRHVHTLPYG